MYIYHARLKNQPSNKSPNNQNKFEEKKVTKCQKLHIVSFHLNLNPWKDVP